MHLTKSYVNFAHFLTSWRIALFALHLESSCVYLTQRNHNRSNING
ncbi:hypothetical protein CPL00366_CDS0026 [Klebsiella phage RareGolfball]